MRSKSDHAWRMAAQCAKLAQDADEKDEREFYVRMRDSWITVANRYEFLDVIEPLRDPRAHGGDPADAMHVVCPTLPGYGFSDKPARPGWGVGHIADVWARLMTGLGYDRFGAQGGDWGSAVTT